MLFLDKERGESQVTSIDPIFRETRDDRVRRKYTERGFRSFKSHLRRRGPTHLLVSFSHTLRRTHPDFQSRPLPLVVKMSMR